MQKTAPLNFCTPPLPDEQRMNIVKQYTFGEVEAFRLGFSPVGPPLMSVFFYIADGMVIDTGQRNMQKYVLELLKDKNPAQVLLTHHHEDHSGNAAAINRVRHIPVRGHSLTAKKMDAPFRILPYQHYIWGRTTPVKISPLTPIIETERLRFRPIHTPGHSKDHTVYLEEQNGWLFSGDLYLGDKIKFFRSDERITDQIASLKKVLEFDFESLFCAHRPCIKNGKTHLRNKLDFLEEFYGNILILMQKGFSEKEIIRKTGNGADRKVKWVTMGNASFANMVRSVIRSEESEDYFSE
jgi:glyoxylase-like metal-dependent hydrolase (beta-lactamase superfamily II)